MFFRFIVLMKVTWSTFIYFLNAWNFFIKKNCSDNLNYYTTLIPFIPNILIRSYSFHTKKQSINYCNFTWFPSAETMLIHKILIPENQVKYRYLCSFTLPEAYLRAFQTSLMKLFAKIDNGKKLTSLAKTCTIECIKLP